MSKNKLLIITIILVVCIALVTIIYNSVFKGESVLDKTYREIYEGLSEEEQNRLKDKYKEYQETDSIRDKMEIEVEIPETIKEKLYPDVFTKPFKDFMNK